MAARGRDRAFVLLVATELVDAVKRRGLVGAEELLREAILQAGLSPERLAYTRDAEERQ